MNSISNIKADLRRWLGQKRYALMYAGRDRRLASQAEHAQNNWIRTATENLPELPRSHNVTHEIHMTSGEGQALMGIWSSFSLMRFFDDARLVLHADASLTDETLAQWSRIIPDMRIVRHDETEQMSRDMLASFPNVLNWCQKYHFGSKLGSVQATASTFRLTDADTDTLTLNDPLIARNCIKSSDWLLAWNLDLRYSYAYPEQTLRNILGDLLGTLPDRLNGGFLVCFKFTDREWQLLDKVLHRLEQSAETDPLRYWMHQTLLAIVASNLGAAARPLPAPYDIHDGVTREGQVVRHYVGAPGIRPRFFTEGIPQLIQDARKRGHLPEDFCAEHVPLR